MPLPKPLPNNRHATADSRHTAAWQAHSSVVATFAPSGAQKQLSPLVFFFSSHHFRHQFPIQHNAAFLIATTSTLLHIPTDTMKTTVSLMAAMAAAVSGGFAFLASHPVEHRLTNLTGIALPAVSHCTTTPAVTAPAA
jgi:hypothetical protein